MIHTRDRLRRYLPAMLAVACLAGVTLPARAAESAACQSAPPFPAGLSEASIEVGGKLRHFTFYVPRRYRGTRAVPLVIDLQASGISTAVELQVTGMDKAAEAQDFLVVLPAAATPWSRGGNTWNVPPRPGAVDDVAFLERLLDTLEGGFCIDPARVYAVGYSGGARLASLLACALPDRIAAIAVVAGLRYPKGGENGCDAGSRAMPVLAFHSIDDPVNPYSLTADAHPPYWTYGIEEALAGWARHNGCDGQPARDRLAEGIERLHYAGCRAPGAVELYRLAGSGHTWPGSRFAFPAFVGATETRIDATALMVSFLSRYSLSAE